LASTTAARASQNSAIVVAQARRPATSSAASQYLALSLIAFIWAANNWNDPNAATSDNPDRATSTWGAGSSLTVICGVAGEAAVHGPAW